MRPTKHLQGVCANCGGPLRFLADRIGSTTQCPHCGRPTELLLAPPPADTSASRKMILWTVIGVVVVALGIIIPVAGLKYLQKKAAERRASQPEAAAQTNSP